jgi:hypothetical protein
MLAAALSDGAHGIAAPRGRMLSAAS